MALQLLSLVIFFASVQGQYAFAAYDAERKQVFAARDPSGKEPLFYSIAEDGGVSFANQALAARGLDESWQALLPGERGFQDDVASRGLAAVSGSTCNALAEGSDVGLHSTRTGFPISRVIFQETRAAGG